MPNPTIETIQSKYDDELARIIRQAGKEFGAVGEGFGPSDDEVGAMSRHYDPQLRSQYYVVRMNGLVLGGCGVAAFNGSSDWCELRKLFLLPNARGQGLGLALTEQCLSFAKAAGYNHCYLDTLSNMTVAIRLYEKIGFQKLTRPLEGTVHNRCDVWMMKTL